MNYNFSGMPLRTDIPPPAPLMSREDAVFVQALAAAVTDVIERRSHAQEQPSLKKLDETTVEMKKARKAFVKATPVSEASESTLKESFQNEFKDMAEKIHKNVIEGVEEQLKKQRNDYAVSISENFKSCEATMATLKQSFHNELKDVAEKIHKNVIEGVEEQLKKQNTGHAVSISENFKSCEATMATLKQSFHNELKDVAEKIHKNVIEGVEEQLKKQRNDYLASVAENYKSCEATMATLKQSFHNEFKDVAEKVHKSIMGDVESLGSNLLAKVEVVGKKIEDKIMAKLNEKLAEQRAEVDRDSSISYDLDNGDDDKEADEGLKDLDQLENEIGKCFGKTMTVKPTAGTSNKKTLSLLKTSTKSPKPVNKRTRRNYKQVGGSDDDEKSKSSKTKRS